MYRLPRRTRGLHLTCGGDSVGVEGRLCAFHVRDLSLTGLGVRGAWNQLKFGGSWKLQVDFQLFMLFKGLF